MARNIWNLFDEPVATNGLKTTGNDPLNQIASWYQFGQNLRQGAEAQRAQREAQEMARREANSGQVPQSNAIGASADGVYGVSGTPVQPTVGIGADASGVFGTGQPSGVYGNFTGQVPNSPVPVNNDSMGSNPLGGLAKLATTSGLDLLKGLKGGNKESDQGNGFGQAIGNAEDNPFGNFTGGSVANFLNPASSNSAQVAGGATSLSADNPFARSSKYLAEQYDKMAYVKQALADGVKNPLVAMHMYDTMIAPLREQAKQDELRNAFFVLQDPNSSEKDRMNAMALIEYHKKDPFLEENYQYKMGNVANPNYGSGSSAGDAVLKALGNYTEGDQWMSPDGTGDSRTQCSNFVSDVLRKIGLNIGSPNGDELMRQFGSAYHTGLDGIQAGDVLNFKDHVGIYVGNGQYVARNSSGGVHQGSMEEAIQAFGQPLGYGSVGELTGTSRRQRFIKDPNQISKLDLLNMRHQNRLEEIAALNAYKNGSKNTIGTSTKNEVGMRQSAMNLASLQNVSADDEKGKQNYVKAMDDFAKNIANSYDLKGSNLESGDLGVALYKKLNETKSGLRPESLARAAATAVYLARGDVDAVELQKHILRQIYSEGNQNAEKQTTAQTSSTGQKQKNLSEVATSNSRNDLDERQQAGALRELDEINHYDQKPTITSLKEVANFVKGGGKIGDDKVGDEIVAMIENAGKSQVTPKRRSR